MNNATTTQQANPEPAMNTIMSKTTYATATNAARAGAKAQPVRFVGTHKLPSGRFCYTFAEIVFSA